MRGLSFTGPAADALVGHVIRMACVAFAAAVVALPGVLSLPPLDRDEARFAQATVQMLEGGDYITIRFQGQERNKKPPAIHWMQAASVSLFSEPERREIWPYRLPSMLGAALACIFTYAAGARLYDPSTGLLAALLLAASPLFVAEAAIAKTDAMLLGCLVAGQAAIIKTYLDAADKNPTHPAWAVLLWVSLAASILIKGPVALLICALTIAAIVAADRTTVWVGRLYPAAGGAMLVLATAPWALAIAEATEGRFFLEALGKDFFPKFFEAQEGHYGPPGYHLALSALLFWPASALLLPAAVQAVRSRKMASSLALLAWLAPTWIILELTATKLPHYALPLYPALAILCARTAIAGVGAPAPAIKAGAMIYGVTGVAAAITTAVLTDRLTGGNAGVAVLTGASFLALASIATAVLFWKNKLSTGLGVAIALAALMNAWLAAVALPHSQMLTLSTKLSSTLDDLGLHPLHDLAADVVLAGYGEPSAIFLIGTGASVTDGVGAARHINTHAEAVAVVEEAVRADFLHESAILDMQLLNIAVVSGANYSKGRAARLHIYRTQQ